MDIFLTYLICLLVGYLSGSVLFAYIITKLVKGEDIRNLGNNNPGAGNTFNNTGKFWGILTGLLDISKAYIPMYLARYFFPDLSTISLGLIGIGAIIGHGYPVFFNFKGGRAAATLIGIYLFFIPYEFLAAFIITPLIVLFFIKKSQGFWIPLGIITLSAVICLFFNHPLDVKIMVWASGILGLYFNRHHLPLRIKELLQKEDKQ